jgi:hypothetical protein
LRIKRVELTRKTWYARRSKTSAWECRHLEAGRGP